MLTDMQCEILQGWYIGRPAPAAEIASLLARRPRPYESPGIHEVPANGIPAMAAASTVSATRSSFSR